MGERPFSLQCGNRARSAIPNNQCLSPGARVCWPSVAVEFPARYYVRAELWGADLKVRFASACAENYARTMDNEVKQRNRRRKRAQRMQAQRESKQKDGDSGEDESPVREKPQRPPNRRKKSKEPLVEEDIVDGFAILGFRTYEDLEVGLHPISFVRLPTVHQVSPDTAGPSPGQRYRRHALTQLALAVPNFLRRLFHFRTFKPNGF